MLSYIQEDFDALEPSCEDYGRIALIKVVAAEIAAGLVAAQCFVARFVVPFLACE